MTGGRRRFDILGIMILAMQDDQFFQTAGNVEFSTDEIAQVSGPQKRTFPGVAQMRFKNFARLIRSSPITPSNVWSGNPDFTFGSVRTESMSFRIINQHAFSIPALPATDDFTLARQQKWLGRRAARD